MASNTDPAEIIRAVGLISEPGQVVEVRAPDAVTRDSNYPRTISGYFNDWHLLADAVTAMGIRSGTYFTLNPVNPALLARAANRIRPLGKKDPTTDDGNILRRRWLPLDFDPVRPSGISSSDTEHAAALFKAHAVRDAMLGEEWGVPILADSGNGAHLLYRVDLAADDGGLVEKILKALAARFSDDTVKVDTGVFNAARIWKLYGTMSRKGDDTPDRPHRMARILDIPDTMERGI